LREKGKALIIRREGTRKTSKKGGASGGIRLERERVGTEMTETGLLRVRSPSQFCLSNGGKEMREQGKSCHKLTKGRGISDGVITSGLIYGIN